MAAAGKAQRNQKQKQKQEAGGQTVGRGRPRKRGERGQESRGSGQDRATVDGKGTGASEAKRIKMGFSRALTGGKRELLIEEVASR